MVWNIPFSAYYVAHADKIHKIAHTTKKDYKKAKLVTLSSELALERAYVLLFWGK